MVRIINVPAHRQPTVRESVIRYAPPVIAPQIQIAPQIFVPDVPAGGSTMISEDDICMLAMDAYEMKDADTESYTTGENGKRVSMANTVKHEDKYNFEGITFPTPLSDMAKFEKNKRNVSINVYGLDKKFQIPKVPSYEVYPLRVVNEEKKDHFDLLMVTDGENSHYAYISNFSRLIPGKKLEMTGKLWNQNASK
ncbi:Uncharacterized protein FWK35_00017046 [Aphis craccivora]|uniref:Uncharacterized protein n=1 Tax=Aphis craccivora TaxID=307492 RepID=A0A6G0X6E7_APHCR|nr:Uncharacterized protein FWK35_00017046 [Aphis craccivora]